VIENEEIAGPSSEPLEHLTAGFGDVNRHTIEVSLDGGGHASR
jgi:hypothetical protein